MANEEFEHRYPDGSFQYPYHPSMQRFLQADGPYSADRPVLDRKEPQFSGKDQEPMALEYYGSPNPWPHGINTGYDPSPPDTRSSEWASLDQESCSGTTGHSWSPQATESCSEYDPRYPSWTASQPLATPYAFPGYSNGLAAHAAGTTSPHLYTAALSTIQNYPDTEAEDGSMKGEMHTPDHIYSAIAARPDPGTTSFDRDEGSRTEDENIAMESTNGDSDEDNGSDYSPKTRSKRNNNNNTRPRNQ
ncbi:MAG: hypothetical protein Q9224_002530, partial [Gallowayella concinna]